MCRRSLEALGLQLETMGWLPSKHPLTEELSFVRSIPAAAKSLSPSSAEKTVFSEAVDGVVTQAGMVNLVCDHSDLVGGTRCLALHMSAKATEWELDPGFHFVCGAPVTNEDKGSCGRHAHTQDRMVFKIPESGVSLVANDVGLAIMEPTTWEELRVQGIPSTAKLFNGTVSDLSTQQQQQQQQ